MGVVNDAMEAVEVILGKLWTIGLILIAFSILALFAPKFRLELPLIVRDWSGAGLLAGFSMVITSVIIGAVDQIKSAYAARQRRLAALAVELQHDNEAIANVQALDPTEAIALLELLEHPTGRYEVSRSSGAYTLVSKRILKAVHAVGGSAYTSSNSVLCELSASVIREADAIREDLLSAVKANPYLFQGLGSKYLTPEDFRKAGPPQGGRF